MSELETKERLIRVAIDLFSTKGFAGTSIRDIAKAMGMSISSIYHYYGSKEGILLAILQLSSRPLIEELDRAAGLDLPAPERFANFVQAHLVLSQRVHSESRMYTTELDQFPPEAREVMRLIQRNILGAYLDQLQILHDLGFLRSENLTVTAFNIIAVVNWPLRWYRPAGGLSFDEVTEEILSFVINGALVPEAANALIESRLASHRSAG